ncbi:MAG: UDP-glucose/GDP-mannose dehydrogenase family protein [Pseudomonadota bacterium]
MKIAVAGTGYVGLVSGVCLAAKGHDVVCVDVDDAKVDKINRGEPPIYENGLERLLKENLGQRLRASTDLRAAVIESDLSLIAVGTPFDGSAIDVSYIRQVTREIGVALRERSGYHMVVVKSTVVPGTTDDVVLPILERESNKKAGVHFGVGMNPEFLREGDAISDFMNPDRIVVGGNDDKARDMLAAVYAPFEGVEIVRTNPKTAEMIKYAANSLLATLISFSNEIGNLCAGIGDIDAMDVMRGVHLDKRFSPILADGSRIFPSSNTYLEAGCGFGGSCFPKDVKALIAHGQRHGQAMSLLDAVIAVNTAQPQKMLEMLDDHIANRKGVHVAVLGLAFKPGTDDMRESPSIPVIQALAAEGAVIHAYDPIAADEARHTFAELDIVYANSMADAVADAEAVLLMTRWDEFEALPEIVRALDPSPVVIDGRRMLAKDAVPRYEGIGL